MPLSDQPRIGITFSVLNKILLVALRLLGQGGVVTNYYSYLCLKMAGLKCACERIFSFNFDTSVYLLAC